nr:ATP-binding cassette transporter Abcb1-2 [Brachionus angularis]
MEDENQISNNNSKEILINEDKKKKDEKKNLVSIGTLFRYATWIDWLMIIIGSLGGIGTGASFPIMLIFFSNIIDTFTEYGSLNCLGNNTFPNATFPNITFPNQTLPFDLNGKMKEQAIYLCILAVATLFLSYFQVSFWIMPAERQTRLIRKALFSSILKQEIGWFDTYKDGSLNNRLTDDINKIKDGISDKFGNALQFFSTFVSGLILGFIRGWKLTLVILSISPILFICAVIFTKLVDVLTKNELTSYAKAGTVAEEVITAIRTVFAFNGSKKEHERYEVKLEEARKTGIKKSLTQGLLFGIIWLVIQGGYALGFWYGWSLTEIDPITYKQDYSVGKILLVFFSIISAVFSLGNAAPFVSNLATARAAAYEVFSIIDRKPEIDSQSTEGQKIENLIGKIEFENVEFNYPSRKEVKILDKLSLKIKPGQTVALVGSSGSGKSTCIQLLQRFYNPLSGSIKFDDININYLNTNWLRSQLGVVNQEPILFGTSIIENIRYGRDNLTEEEIISAAKYANAHEFIMNLPEKYNTLVGDRGSQLSGGQKQRIAIARALVRNPKILLLDEATSALDNESEAIVQSALDQARLGRTTIIVAHRLSTIRNADVIYALDKGVLGEFGTHEELMSKKGIYYTLVKSQEMGSFNQKDKKKSKLNLEHKKEDLNLEKNEKEILQDKDQDNKSKLPEPSLKRIFLLNKPEWLYIFIGCIASLVSGGVQPAFSIVFSKVIAVFQICDRKEQERDVILYCLIFIGFGIVTFFSNLFQNLMFGISGENMTKRIRSTAFKAMLSQDIEYFDKKENNVGILTTRLAVEAAAVQGATGVRIGGLLMNIGNFGIGLLLAFIYGWAITLVIIAFVPFIIVSGVLQTKLLTGFSGKDKETIEEAGKITNEAISNIKTVAILNKESYFSELYSNKIDIPYKASIKSANLYGFMLGFSSSIIFFATAAAFVVGGIIIEKDLFGLDFQKIMLVFSCVIFGAQSVGQASSLMPDYAKAKVAVQKIFELFDTVPKINNWESNTGVILNNLNGDIEFNSVQFRYPNRPDARVLENLNISIKQGQQIALVGSSGCGKSTVTQLLERFYDSNSGELKINGFKIQDLNLHWLRSQIGIVSQEPILFDRSIAENIAYGDNSRKVSMDEIIEAAKKANIHEFIINLPQKYDTNVGSKGTQLSGGQKQRISIARALIRDPKILILDEATSALDTESEKIVQDALEKAQKGRTCIIIAHRLSTIRNCDVIFVIQEGKVIETGNHEILMNANGFYTKLNNKNFDGDD